MQDPYRFVVEEVIYYLHDKVKSALYRL